MHGQLTGSDFAALATLLSRCATVPAVFAHADALFTHCFATHEGVALIDWASAGHLLPGYDHALMWTLLGDHPGARHTVEHAVDAHGIPRDAFLINLAAVLTRVIRLHAELRHNADQEHRVTTLRQDWRRLRRLLREATLSP